MKGLVSSALMWSWCRTKIFMFPGKKLKTLIKISCRPVVKLKDWYKVKVIPKHWMIG